MYLAALVFFPFVAGLLSFGAGVLSVQGNQKKGEGSRQNDLRDAVAILSTALEFAGMLILAVKAGAGSSYALTIPGVCGFGLSFTLDGFRTLYGCIASFMWMAAAAMSREYLKGHRNRNRFYLFLLWTLGATMGVFLSADLYTTFLFFEIMSFTSYVWVAQEETGPALRAAATYLAVAVIGGLAMLMGIFLLYCQLGTLRMEDIASAAKVCENKSLIYTAGCCMLAGFGAKAGVFPLHIWLPKAHPVAPAPASALLSGILTKTGIYGALILSSCLFFRDPAWGALNLVLGLITMFGGALLAVFSVDLKHTLACSSMSQIGFILTGIGMQGLLGEENALAVHGTFLHMVNHSLIKLVLFLAAGVIYQNAHALNLNEIRGFGRKKPLLAGIFLTGALAISGIPLFGGYVSKTLLHESIVEYGGGPFMKAAEWIFLFSGGLTAAYMTKLFAAIFIEKNPDDSLQEKYDKTKAYMSPLSGAALTVSALLLFVWGLAPRLTMDRAAEYAQGFMGLEESGHSVAYFSGENLKGALISVAIGALVYFLVIRKLLMKPSGKYSGKTYICAWPAWLDLENLIYRPLLLKILPAILGVICRIPDSLPDAAVVFLRKTVYRDSPIPHERPEGNLFTAALGKILNAFQKTANRTWRRKRPVYKDYVHLAAMRGEELRENNLVIERSLSFGLLLFCIGLSLTLFYLILL